MRYELESYMSQLKVYDNQVDYDTVNISIQEVKNETPTGELSIGQKMLNGLENSLRAIAGECKESVHLVCGQYSVLCDFVCSDICGG